ncbi:hypothetical protein APHAL10511_003440 [Amanita phalloides]|nr:hypothetical protein APHAL10511_003440 [Amanita phalloides]
MNRKPFPWPDAILQRIVFYADHGSEPSHHAVTVASKLRAHDNGSLKSLRLTSKAFCEAATPSVFKCVAFFPAIGSSRVDMQGLMRIVNSGIAAYVKTLIIRPMVTASVDDQWSQSARFAHALPVCFAMFKNLSAIAIDGGVFLGINKQLKYSHTAPLLSSLRRSFVKALHSGLSNASLGSLKGLELDFPVLEGFFESFTEQNIFDHFSGVLCRLERLSVTVQFRHRVTSHGTQQFSCPDLQHQGRFWALIGLATNLRSLKIYSSNVLDLDNIPLSSLGRLEELDLCRVRCRTDTLIAMCFPRSASIKVLRLSEVRLITGIWADVFFRIKDIPTLAEFYARSLTYDAPSPHFARILHPLNSCLEIPRRDDCDAIQELTKAVGQRQHLSKLRAPYNESDGIDDS